MKKKPIKWTEKILPMVEIREEPALNKEGFWKKPKPFEIEVRKNGKWLLS